MIGLFCFIKSAILSDRYIGIICPIEFKSEYKNGERKKLACSQNISLL